MTLNKPKISTKPEAVVREIKRATPKKYSADEKIRIILEGLRGETTINELCRREGIQSNMYYRWSKACPRENGEHLEAGKKLSLVKSPSGLKSLCESLYSDCILSQ